MEETFELDIKELAKALWKRIWIIILCAAIMASAVLAFTAVFVPRQYKAEVMIYVNNNSDKNNTALNSADLAVALRLVGTYVNILKSNSVLTKVIDKADVDLEPEQVRRMLTAEAVEETEIFRVSIMNTDPQVAADIANAIADAAPVEIPAIIDGSSAKVIDYATPPTSPSSPNYLVTTLVGALVGVVLAVVGIMIHMLLDKRIKSEEDLMKIHALPVLGKIPDMNLSREQYKKERR